MSEYKITVCTPTYNRANLIEGVYNSLKNQTFKDFEWIVVDDGSMDNTKEVIERFIKESDFPIKYIFQENGGKHRAVNKALDIAKGELFLIFDSDDKCENSTFEIFYKYYEKYKDQVIGVVTLSKYTNNKIIGDKFPNNEMITTLNDMFFIKGIKGDKFIILRTDIFKQHKFPEFENEKFIAESSVWNLIGEKYKFVFLNIPLQIKEYYKGGLSSKSKILRKNNPKGAVYVYSNRLFLNLPFKEKVKALINCFRFGIWSIGAIKLCFYKILKGKNEC